LRIETHGVKKSNVFPVDEIQTYSTSIIIRGGRVSLPPISIVMIHVQEGSLDVRNGHC